VVEVALHFIERELCPSLMSLSDYQELEAHKRELLAQMDGPLRGYIFAAIIKELNRATVEDRSIEPSDLFQDIKLSAMKKADELLTPDRAKLSTRLTAFAKQFVSWTTWGWYRKHKRLSDHPGRTWEVEIVSDAELAERRAMKAKERAA